MFSVSYVNRFGRTFQMGAYSTKRGASVAIARHRNVMGDYGLSFVYSVIEM